MIVIDLEQEYAYLMDNDTITVVERQVEEMIQQVFENIHGTKAEFLNRLLTLPDFKRVFWQVDDRYIAAGEVPENQMIDITKLAPLKARVQEVGLSILFKVMELNLFQEKNNSGMTTFNYFPARLNKRIAILMADEVFDRMDDNILSKTSF